MMVALAAFTEFCQSIAALAKLALKLTPYIDEWLDKRDTDELKILLDSHTPADSIRAALLSARIKKRRSAQP